MTTSSSSSQALLSWTSEQWHLLEIYDQPTQALITYLSDTPRPSEDIKDALLRQYQGGAQTLIQLTFDDLLQRLVTLQYVSQDQDVFDLTEVLREQINSIVEGRFDEEDPQDISDHSSIIFEDDLPSAPSTDSDQKYIDPLDRISTKDESIYTIRRLNQILNALDGLTLMHAQLRESVQMELSDFNRLLQKMSDFDLIRYEDHRIKLHFHGSKIIRLLRDERKKTLARIAERMRRESN